MKGTVQLNFCFYSPSVRQLSPGRLMVHSLQVCRGNGQYQAAGRSSTVTIEQRWRYTHAQSSLNNWRVKRDLCLYIMSCENYVPAKCQRDIHCSVLLLFSVFFQGYQFYFCLCFFSWSLTLQFFLMNSNNQNSLQTMIYFFHLHQN